MWIYQGQELTEENTAGFIGFVYLITNLTNGRKYIGKKLFTKAKTRQIKKKKRKTRVKSDWETYYGSNKELQEDVKILGAENFTREVLHLAKTKGELSYLELKEQIEQNALLRDDYYNDWIYVRVSKAHLKNLISTYPKG